MTLIKCTECKAIISSKAKTCPNCGAPARKPLINPWGFLAAMVVLTGVISAATTPPASAPAPQIESETTTEQKELAAIEKDEEYRRNGYHCLSSWDGKNLDAVQQVKGGLREPDSFEHIETRITPMNESKTHVLVMKFRAKNGFGGMDIGYAAASVDNETCYVKVNSIE